MSKRTVRYVVERHYWRDDLAEWDWEEVGTRDLLTEAMALAADGAAPDEAMRVYAERHEPVKGDPDLWVRSLGFQELNGGEWHAY